MDNAGKIGRPISLATKDRLAANGADQDLKEYYGFGGLELLQFQYSDAEWEEFVSSEGGTLSYE